MSKLKQILSHLIRPIDPDTSPLSIGIIPVYTSEDDKITTQTMIDIDTIPFSLGLAIDVHSGKNKVGLCESDDRTFMLHTDLVKLLSKSNYISIKLSNYIDYLVDSNTSNQVFDTLIIALYDVYSNEYDSFIPILDDLIEAGYNKDMIDDLRVRCHKYSKHSLKDFYSLAMKYLYDTDYTISELDITEEDLLCMQ